jgi:plasmid stabilization system protein ParE
MRWLSWRFFALIKHAQTKDAAREAWRLAVEYRDQAATLGEPPDIGKKPPQIDEA